MFRVSNKILQDSYTFNGKRKSVYGKTRTKVKDKINKALVTIADNKYVDRSEYTLLDIINMNIEQEFNTNKISVIKIKDKIDDKSIYMVWNKNIIHSKNKMEFKNYALNMSKS